MGEGGNRCETTHAVSMFAGIIRDNVSQQQKECSNQNSLCSALAAAQKAFTNAQICELRAGGTALSASMLQGSGDHQECLGGGDDRPGGFYAPPKHPSHHQKYP